MNVKVLGCHGGESKKHRSTSFLVDDRIAIDAGAIAGRLSLEEQSRIEAVLVSHPHLDHVRDLAGLVDNRCQQGGPPLEIVGIADTIATLRTHFFNGRLWPDFTRIPAPDSPTIIFREIDPAAPFTVRGIDVTPVRVNHTIDTVGFILKDDVSTLAYSGDTGPTTLFWDLINALPKLDALLLEVSFPDQFDWLARTSGHLTPATVRTELAKLSAEKSEVPVYAYHLKPVFEGETERELAQIARRDLRILQLDDELALGKR
jgi:cAMP phosphodiesterase